MTRGLITAARRLRRSATDAERVLWQRLRDRQLCGAKFRRQVPIGRYIVDFACTDVRLVVELDGGQHASDETDGTRQRDIEQTGFRVLRFWNSEVLGNIDGVLHAIADALSSTSAPSP